MSKKNKEDQVEGALGRIDEVVVESEHFIEKNKKPLLITLGVIVLAVCAYLGYTQLYHAPKNEEAQIAMYKSEEHFMNLQDSLAIFGDGNEAIGLAAVANKYGSTPAGKLAKLYMGISYARLGNYEEALSQLKGYSGNDLILSHLVNSTIGDCLVATGKQEQAPEYFLKAAKGVDNAMQSPILYKKAADVYRELGNHDKVIEIYTTLQNNYANTRIAMEGLKYIEEAKMLKEAK